MAKEIYWHLPGVTVNFYLNQVIMKMMQDYPDKFREGYKIGSVYGTFPGAIWNGGRAVFGLTAKGDIEKILETYSNFDVPVRFTWTNSLIEEKHLNDTYCNLIMEAANNGKNQVLCNSKLLEDYLREKYPDFKYLSSTTKRIVDVKALKKELEKDYFLVVLDYDLNHDEEALKAVKPYADKIELLVDEVCFPHCPKRVDHYKDESRLQINFERADTPYDCPNFRSKPTFADCKSRPHFIDCDEIEKYAEDGFVNFKLVGRGLPTDMVIDSYVYYLAKREERDFVKKKLMSVLGTLFGGK